VAAADIVRESIPDVRFVIVGDGPELNAIRREVERRKLHSTVILTGFRADAQRIISAFDVFALPSIHEGLSIALIEALSLAKPIVASRAGGVPEVVRDGEQGFLVEPGDADALAKRIITLLLDDALRTRMGDASLRRAAAFDIRNAVKRTEEIYEALLP
jgi:glycosyltransferase involved in cell wall biosynthesis